MNDINHDYRLDDAHQDPLYRAGVDSGIPYAIESATYAEFALLTDDEDLVIDTNRTNLLLALAQHPNLSADGIEWYLLDPDDPFDRGFRDAVMTVWHSATGSGEPVQGLAVALTPGQRHLIARRITQTRLPDDDASFRYAYERGWHWGVREGLDLERELARIDLTNTSVVPYGGMDPKVWTRLTEWIDEWDHYDVVDYDPNDVLHRGLVQGAFDAMDALRNLPLPANQPTT